MAKASVLAQRSFATRRTTAASTGARAGGVRSQMAKLPRDAAPLWRGCGKGRNFREFAEEVSTRGSHCPFVPPLRELRVQGVCESAGDVSDLG